MLGSQMTVLQKLLNSYEEGAYGVVFFVEQSYAIKVFKRCTDVPENHVNAVFQAELEAYRIASETEELKAVIPEFFGAITCTQVLDNAGKDISDKFYLSFAYKMSKVDGDFKKCGLNDERLESAFRRVGIHHTTDASVLFEDGEVKCIVDFATKEHELPSNYIPSDL